MNTLISQVEKRKDEVKIGTILVYIDSCNYMKYEVIDVDSESFECIDLDTKQNEIYFFNELQHGWDFL